MSFVNNLLINGLVVIFLSGTSLYLGLLAYIKNKKALTHRVFARFAVATSLWIFLAYLPDVPYFRGSALTIAKLNYFALLTVSFSIFELPFVFPKQRHLNVFIKYAMLAIGIFIGFLILTTNLIIKELAYFYWGASYVDGDMAGLFYLYMMFGPLSALIQYVYLLRKLNPRERVQIKFFLTGLSIFMLMNILLQSIVKPMITHDDSLYKIGNYSAIFMITFTAYAIIKHRFMDIRLIVARAVSYSLLLLTLGFLYSFALFSIGIFFFPEGFGGSQLFISVLLALIGAFLFQPLRRYIESLTDSIFYQGKYDSQIVLSHLSTIMASTLKLEELTHLLLKDLLEQAKISRGAFILMEQGKVYDFKSEGFEKPPALTEEELQDLYEQNELLVFEELPEGHIKNILRKYDLTVISPLHVKGEEIGLLALGEKLSGDIYTNQDLQLIEILSPEVAVTIKNAKSYEEIRRFNITLREEVERATKELRVANEKLKELDKLKDEFISMASHELKTPTGAIRDRLWMIENKSGELDTKQQKHIEVAYSEANRLLNLVNDMLNVSRIEQNRIQLNIGEVDLDEIIYEVIDEYKASAEKRNLELKFITIKKKLPKVHADPDKIKIVLGNLLSNAIKFTEKGFIHIETYKKGNYVQVNVTDTGKGIAWQDISKLFEKFSRLESAQERVEKGTGLGLYIAKKFVELMKGTIWVESTLGKGSTFSFTLPIRNK